MLITDSQRTALQTLIELTAHERALRFEYDNPKRAEELQELISRHKELGEKRTEAAAVVDSHQQTIAEATRLIEAQRSTIEKKTAELNDGTGLTSRDMVHLQEEIAGHESRVSELEESQLEEMEKLEAAEDELAALDERIADVTASGKEVQTAVKDRKAELRELIAESESAESGPRSEMPQQLLSAFDANVRQGGPGAALLNGPNCQACGQEIGGAAWHEMIGADVNETYECEECEAVLLRRS
ncbi:zinc ribbon domain-containing protein [Brevibacterium linens]|uniref:zinc ribbon domain-containing protein n=1 Tax=Brevibacterium linens TaxID=1703 RepID=UPI003F8C7BC6